MMEDYLYISFHGLHISIKHLDIILLIYYIEISCHALHINNGY